MSKDRWADGDPEGTDSINALETKQILHFLVEQGNKELSQR